MDIHSIWDTLFGENKTYKKPDDEEQLIVAKANRVAALRALDSLVSVDWSGFMHENEGKLWPIAAAISKRPEEHRDALVAGIHEWLLHQAYLLKHRPRHELPKEE